MTGAGGLDIGHRKHEAIKEPLDADVFCRSGHLSSSLINAMILNDYFYSASRFTWQLRVGFRSSLRPVPQVIVNRKTKLASWRAAVQPNYALDRVWAKRIPGAVQNGNAGREGGLEKGKNHPHFEHEKGARPVGPTP